jgi:uncharacterized repeat protein (TIGR04138 family)
MADERSDEDKLEAILRREDRYRREAYAFVQESLEHTRRRLTRRGHVTGRELAEGVRELAKERFGLLAKTVLNQWGVHSTRDIGNLVFNMIDEKIMVKQDSDRPEDFDGVYDFDEAFGSGFKIELES